MPGAARVQFASCRAVERVTPLPLRSATVRTSRGPHSRSLDAEGFQRSRPNNQVFRFWSVLTKNIQGTFSFAASAPVSVIALRGFVNERSDFLMSTLPVTDLAARRDQSVTFPYVADGGGWTNRIFLTNPTDQTLTGRLQFISQSGQALSVVLDGQAGTDFNYSTPARGSKTFVTGNASPSVHIGWIRVVPSTGADYPTGVLIFSYKPASVVITEAAIAASAPCTWKKAIPSGPVSPLQIPHGCCSGHV